MPIPAHAPVVLPPPPPAAHVAWHAVAAAALAASAAVLDASTVPTFDAASLAALNASTPASPAPSVYSAAADATPENGPPPPGPGPARTLYLLGWLFPPLWLAGAALALVYALRRAPVRDLEGGARQADARRAAVHWGLRSLAALLGVLATAALGARLSFPLANSP